ncbi:MAG: phage portal protein, partial [Candidatus Peregrinibacteria bacterium]|nr:phage portal protein [Candidatus Peregrinibacteria bacterium]
MPRGVPKHNRNISLRGIDSQIIELQIKKNLELEKALTGNDPQQILKAQQYIQSQQKENKGRGDQKSWLFQPDDSSYTGKGYKEAHKSVSFESLKKMSELFVVRLIHDTRIDQVKNFLHFTTDDQKEGFTLKRKRGLFDAQVSDLSKSEQKEVTEIIKFLEGCGNNSKWDNHDDFHEFISKILRDSLTYDQLSFENVRDRGGKLQKIIATDSSLVRLLNSQDPRYYDQFKALEYKGYLPKYCMAHMGDILIHPVTGKQVIFYPWELGFGVRNKTTDVNKQGYGIGELEVSMQLVTYILWSFQYNGNFFKQGSQPKGFINIKDGNMDNTTLNDFKDNWRQLMTSVHNSHKTPVFEGIDLEWIDLQKGNRDMEFNQWVEFLLVIFCSTYRIDPSELGFNFAQASNMFGQDGQK